jgi:hypothetical protein
MATLGSPGVSVSVIDESFYTPAAPGTTPIIFVATAQDKSNASATGTAQGTTAANAGKVYVITSQRDLTDTFGTPQFYTDASGNPIHGNELNEYGLQAAYSALGVSARAYIVRADVNLSQLIPSTSIPTGTPVAGTYWIDSDSSLYGIKEFDASGSVGKFVTKTPLIIDNDNITNSLVWNSGTSKPADSFGQRGEYAMAVVSQNTNALFYKTATSPNAWVLVQGGFDGGNKKVQLSPHTDYPTWAPGTAATGSIWIQTTTPGAGANWLVKYYNGSTKSWTTVNSPIYNSARQALEKLDYTGGGKNIPVGTLFIESDYNHYGLADSATARAVFKVWRRNSTSPTTIVSGGSIVRSGNNSRFTIRETLSSSNAWGATKTIEVLGSNSVSVGAQIPAALSAAGLVNVTATYDTTTNKVTFSHALGGDFELTDGLNSPLDTIGLTAYNVTTKLGTANLYAAPTQDNFTFIATNWKPLVYEAKKTVPTVNPDNGRLWYDSAVGEVDIMIHDGTNWVGYQNYGGYSDTNPTGPIISATQPTTQTDGSDLVDGDIWISTADTEMYGKNIYVYDGVATLKWILQDTADQHTPNGWVFADARWSDNGVDGPNYVTPITDLLISNYVDPDAPDPALYPKGMKLWNLRRSGYNVKKFVKGHLNLEANLGKNIRFGNDYMIDPATGLPIYSADRWVTISPNAADGSGAFGRHAQRGYIVSKLKALINTNAAIRDSDTLIFNLIATPGYPETIAEMVAFNIDRGQTAFVVGDTPLRLEPTATTLQAWGNNTTALDNGDNGAVTYDEYLGLFYPSGYTSDNSGNNIVVPPSHMMLRTIINSDAKSYQWFAPAGTRRGGVDNASSVGYITGEGEFKTAALYEGLRNVLHDVKINPIATLPGVGIANFGQYTRAKNASSLDRINVVRLLAYLRRQLTILSKPYLFEPNDQQTRREIKAAAESLLLELVGQRALYDFVVVCDSTNNTPARIDRSELYMDIAIEPVKAVEFIYIPLRIKNTGSIAAGL